jgi:hypothetical protein
MQREIFSESRRRRLNRAGGQGLSRPSYRL